MQFEQGQSNWLFAIIPASWEGEAMAIRKQRDEKHPNIFLEENTDLRWVGDLGEIVFVAWLQAVGIANYQWHQFKATGEPDFTIKDIRIDIKTVKRKVPPRPDYTAQITARHIHHPIDELFFMTYEFDKKKMWLLGGAKMSEFIKFAQYYSEGEFVHPKYQIRKGHEIYNASIDKLKRPRDWIKMLQ
jgi:hypothetical protein